MLRKTIVYICSITFLFLIFSNNAFAYAIDYKTELLVDNFTKDIQKHLETVRLVERAEENPINKSEMSIIEDKYEDIFDLIDLEIIRLDGINLSQLKRLEVESVLLEINDQFEQTFDNLENKIDNDLDDDFDKIKTDFLSKSLSYRKDLKSLISDKTSKTGTTRTSQLLEVNKVTEEFDVVYEKIKGILRDFENMTLEAKNSSASISIVNGFYLDSFDLIEKAEDEMKKLPKITDEENRKLKSTINDIEDEIDNFVDELESSSNDFLPTYLDEINDIKQVLSSGFSQFNTAFNDVISRNSYQDLPVDDVLDNLDRLIIRAQGKTRDIPSNERGEIANKLQDLYDDFEVTDKDDIKKTIEELRAEFNISSIYELDFEEDMKYFSDYVIKGFSNIRKDSFTTSIAKVLSSLDEYITEMDTKTSDFKSSYSSVDDLEDTEKELESIIYKARNSIYELTLVGVDNTNFDLINTKINALQVATSETLDELIDRSSSGLKTNYDKIVFDLIGMVETTGASAVTTYSLITNLHTIASDIKDSNTQTTPNDVITFIDNKINTLYSLENSWGNEASSLTKYREAELSIRRLFDDVSFEINRLIGYDFNTSVDSYILANNIGHYYRNIINEAEDNVSLINSSISTVNNDDLEEKIIDLYEDIDYGISLLQDNMSSSLDPLIITDIVNDIEDEKERLDRAFNSLTVSSTSSSTNNIDSIKDNFSDIKEDLTDVIGSIPTPLDSYNDFENISEDLLDAITDIEKATKNAHAKSLDYDEKLDIDISFYEVIDELTLIMNKILDNKDSKLNSEYRSLKRKVFDSYIKSKIIMDDIKIDPLEKYDYTLSKNISKLNIAINKLSFVYSSFDDLEDYHSNLDDFKENYRNVLLEIELLIENKPVQQEENKSDIETAKESFDDNYKNSIDSIGDALFDNDDDEYIENGFNTYMSRYTQIFNSLFEGALNGYNPPSYEFIELYEQGDAEELTSEEDEEDIFEGVDTDFNDVKKDNVFSPYILKLYENKSINGYSDGNFYPDKLVTRAEFIKIAVITQGYEADSSSTDDIIFTDVNKEDPLAPYIKYGIKKGYIKGFSEDIFKPNDPISRIDAGRILIRMLNLSSLNSPVKSKYFSDILSPDLAMLTDILYDSNILSGYKDGTFKPYNSITRGESSKIISNSFLF